MTEDEIAQLRWWCKLRLPMEYKFGVNNWQTTTAYEYIFDNLDTADVVKFTDRFKFRLKPSP